MRMPDFFIVGQPKSGTTALYEMLRRHPQIFMPELKEPMFLASDLLAGLRRPSVRARPRTLEEYLALFAGASADQRAGEASSLYLSSHDAAANVATLQPAARIVAIVREPAALLSSLHLQLLQDHNEQETDLRRALALEGERREGRRIPPRCARPASLFYSDHVRYVEQLQRFRDAFPAEQILVLLYDDFRAENAETVRRVLDFLEVDAGVEIEPVEANPTVRLRSGQLEGVVKGVYRGRGPLMRAVGTPVKKLVPRRVRRGALAITRRRVLYGERQPIGADVELELRRRYKGEVIALSEFLGRDLVSVWGYDGID